MWSATAASASPAGSLFEARRYQLPHRPAKCFRGASNVGTFARARCSIPMAMFYFDFRDNDQFTRDDEGLEFPSIEKARDNAARCLAEMAKFVLPGSVVRELAIEVRDAAKQPLLRTILRYDVQPLG